MILATTADHNLSPPLPTDLKYARGFFPVLAALLYSGHIRKGDIIDLPLPCPECWPQTVAHAYTGQGELTEAIRQNICTWAERCEEEIGVGGAPHYSSLLPSSRPTPHDLERPRCLGYQSAPHCTFG